MSFEPLLSGAVSRLVVVSNRVTPISGSKAATAGGLAVGILAALRETGGIWFGWSGEQSDAAAPIPKVSRTGNITYITIDLAPRAFESYYGGFANRTLWPLFHYRLDLSSFDRDWYVAYRQVNQLFAEQLYPYLRDDDLLWVHDYHLIPMGEELRRLGVRCRIGFFLHVPFPSTEVYVALPWHDQLVQAMCAYDLLGFQTSNDLRNFHDYLYREGIGYALADGLIHAFGATLRAQEFPIGIDTDDFAAMATSAEAVRASQRLSRTFVQISAPSREDVPEYLELRRQVEATSGRINGLFSEFDWMPLRYLNRGFTRRTLAGFFRLSRIGLVTPLRDGMNLVAKEYVAAQSDEDPGVLVLSRFAGAADDMDGAVIVNPYDIEAVAEAMHFGLTMPLDERQDRWRRLFAQVQQHDIAQWRRNFVQALAESGQAAS